MYALQVEALGKQAYIFGSNKLRESVGASQLVALSTTDWLDDALRELESSSPHVSVTTVVSVSGLAILTLDAPSDAEAEDACRFVVSALTTRALRPSPEASPEESADGGCGLHLLGAWVRLEHDHTTLTVADRESLKSELAAHRVRAAPPQARHTRLPVVAACATSDGPAARLLDDGSGDGPEQLSAVSTAKRAANWRGRTQIRTRIHERLRDRHGQKATGSSDELLIAAGDLEKVLDTEGHWLGVVHADGNQIGKLFAASPDQYSEVSGALDRCTESALADAVEALWELRDRTDPERTGQPLPLVPLIASGDDLAALVDGRYALPFAAAYLRAFERHSATGVLAEAATRADRGDHLTAAAGVAIVKARFPFSVAYELCEQACASAKRLARAAGVSTVDWQVHYDSVGRDLSAVRQDLRWPIGADMTHSFLRRPYGVLRPEVSPPAALAGRNWADLERLADEVPVLPHPRPGEALPASQLERLRTALLTGGPDRAERLYRTLLGRPELSSLLGRLGATLFADTPDPADPDRLVRSTLLLDFLDAEFVAPPADTHNGEGVVA